jgi:hypothetical protein
MNDIPINYYCKGPTNLGFGEPEKDCIKAHGKRCDECKGWAEMVNWLMSQTDHTRKYYHFHNVKCKNSLSTWGDKHDRLSLDCMEQKTRNLCIECSDYYYRLVELRKNMLASVVKTKKQQEERKNKMYPKKLVKKKTVAKKPVKTPDFKTVVTVPVKCATLVTTGGNLEKGRDVLKIEKLDGFAGLNGFVRISVSKFYADNVGDFDDESLSFVVSASDLANVCFDIKNDVI